MNIITLTVGPCTLSILAIFFVKIALCLASICSPIARDATRVPPSREVEAAVPTRVRLNASALEADRPRGTELESHFRARARNRSRVRVRSRFRVPARIRVPARVRSSSRIDRRCPTR